MKSAFFSRTLLLLAALLFSMLTCNAKDDSSDQLVGKWTKLFNERTVTFTITAEDKYTVEFVGDEGIDVEGSYVISGTQITFNDEAGDYSSDEPGIYEFQVSETSLTFTNVNDPVYGRSMLVEGAWTLAKDAK